ncbi:Polyadenylate-binding protein 4 [Hibiscus syriacus]|uniref:Polyadenylate-binding protein 4 n=1 Tax=Hibiscus syriacus TaxID=106335 RepID=A0A6A2ZJ19_HIBSY|nr:Polyadenylate-binding protein 4 [Hibiscus syriacus]
MREPDGKSKGFGFVNFENADDAARAVESLNGKKFDDKEWYVGKAQKKSEREIDLKLRFEQSMKEAADKFQGANLYVKNLDDSISDEKLKERFSQYGTITSCMVMRDPSGVSKGSGFVAFSTPEEASRALAEMNGKMIVSKPLYVALAQRKEDRRARLQAQFSQVRPVAMTPSAAPRMPIYPPGGPGVGQQIFYGQGPLTMFPQPGFGYQQQLVPGMRPGGDPIPNFFVPALQQVQQGQHPGGTRSGTVQQSQQPVPLMQQQVVSTLLGLCNIFGTFVRMFLLLHLIGALASALANATPDQQRTGDFGAASNCSAAYIQLLRRYIPKLNSTMPPKAPEDAKRTAQLIEAMVSHHRRSGYSPKGSAE